MTGKPIWVVAIWACVSRPWVRREPKRTEIDDLLPIEGAGPHYCEGVISTPGDEAGAFLAWMGASLFYEAESGHFGLAAGVAMRSQWRDGKWGEPELLPFQPVSGFFTAAFAGRQGDVLRVDAAAAGLQGAGVADLEGGENRARGGEPAVLPAPVNGPEGHGNWGAQLRGTARSICFGP